MHVSFSGMHLHHYENSKICDGLMSCTAWTDLKAPAIGYTNLNINLSEWVLHEKEKHLFADIKSKSGVDGVIKVVFSKSALETSVSKCTILNTKILPVVALSLTILFTE